MTILDLHIKLKELGIKEEEYYLHGLYGSVNDKDKIALTIRKAEFAVEYETYYKEKGEKHSVRIFNSEKEACLYILSKLIDERTFNKKYR